MIPVLDDLPFLTGAAIGTGIAIYWFLRYRLGLGQDEALLVGLSVVAIALLLIMFSMGAFR